MIELAECTENVGRTDVGANLWAQMMVNHYPDDAIEHAKRECVRIILKANGDLASVSEREAEYLQLLAAVLISSDGEQRHTRAS